MMLNEYQRNAVQTSIYGSGNAIIYPTLGLVGEAGETSNKVKKVLRDGSGVFTQENKDSIMLEVGDVLWYCAALLRDLGYTLEECAQSNLAKLAARQEKGTIAGSGDER